nr:hypothetical protein [Pedobacter panaciterrae]
MKAKSTILKLIVILALMLPITAFAKSYPLYICGATTTATLQPAITGVAPTDQVIWVDVTGGTNTTLKTGSGTDMNYTIAAGLAAGEYTYRVHSVSASPNSCTGDYTEFQFYVLPPITVTLSNPTNENYCEASSGTNTSSSITATTNTLDASLTDVDFAYLWTGTKGGSTIDVSTIGTGETTKTYTLNTTATGSYVFNAAAHYTVASGVLKSTTGNTGCSVTSASSLPVTVTPKPAQPTITIL